VFLVSSTLSERRADQSIGARLVGDGTPLVILTGMALVLAGTIALLLAASGQFLPHDSAFLGMSAGQLCSVDDCRIVRFMVHDRAAFGGTLIAIGVLYAWLARFPLRRGEAWAWWTLAVSGVLGFASFLDYLGYGYLDTWHGVATLGLLPCFVHGLARAYSRLPRGAGPSTLLRPAARVPWASAFGLGRGCLLATALGLVAGGATILAVGTTCVFVPQDLAYLGLSATDLHAINPRLVPLIAHDRAGFGGGVCTCGVLIFFSVWCGDPCRSLWQALCLAGTAGFATAIGVHPLIGYTDPVHLAPAVGGVALYSAGLALTYKPMMLGGGPTALAVSPNPALQPTGPASRPSEVCDPPSRPGGKALSLGGRGSAETVPGAWPP
jgi:MFS family permease